MKPGLIGLATVSALVCMAVKATESPMRIDPSQLLSRPSYPVVREGGYLLLEVWPAVKDITVSAFFLDEMDGKSRILCESVKKSLDHEAEIRARGQKATFSSYRMCMTIRDAERLGWIGAKE